MRHGTKLAIALIMGALAAGAQMQDNQKKDLECRDENSGRSRQQRHCEIREMPGPSTGRLSVDAGRNGGVSVKGWSRNEMLVRAKVESWAENETDAKMMTSQVRLSVNSGRVLVDGPTSANKDQNWSVSFEIFVPHRMDLELTASNGGVHLSDVTGDIQFQTKNGGVHLARLAGRVRGTTTNGGVHVELAGNRWDGSELDVKTTNGGVHLDMPENYSAQLETSTVNGRLQVDAPGARIDKDTRRYASSIGAGGPLVRAVTTNGGVHVGRASK